MSTVVEVKITDDEGEETVHKLPATFQVCRNCEGHGTHMNESMRGHCYTQEEFEQEFSDEMREQYLTRGGIYDVECETCHGKCVVPVVNRAACRTKEQLRILAILDAKERDDADYEQLVQSERRANC